MTATERRDGAPERILYTAAQIGGRVAELGRSITAAYPDGELLVLGLLKGSFVFLADLVRQIRRPLAVDFMVAESYRDGTESSGEVRLVYDPEIDMTGRHVLLVEDIVDSGQTLGELVPRIRDRAPRSLELCALLHKRIAPSLALEARWVGFEAPRLFLVGYGLDYAGQYRNLPYIAAL